MKQTAVQWLFEQFENGDMYNVEDAQRIKHQAIAMEKEQINQACYDGYYHEGMMDTREYYNNTYGKHSQKKS